MANLTEADAIDQGDGKGFIYVLGDTQLDTDNNPIPEADNIDTSAGSLDYSIEGGGGDDIIVTGDGDGDSDNGGHTVQGGAGADTITGGADGDNLLGASFSSTADDGDDTINGGGGNDSISGQLGNDTLNGDAGNDFIWGNEGNDIINGGAGNDLIWGGVGDETIDGGDDYDIVFFDYSINDIESLAYDDGTSTLTVVGLEGTDTATNVEQVSFTDNPVFFDATSVSTMLLGTAGDDTITAVDVAVTEENPTPTENNNYIITGAGDDIINGGLGSDSIVAGKGNDTIDAGDNDDGILSGSGNNAIDGGDGNDTVGYNFARDQITSIKRDANGVITLVHANGTDTLSSVEIFDFYTSDANGNRQRDDQGQLIVEKVEFNDFTTVFTELDDETISGTAGDDALDGGIGDDTISGLAGDDTITGGDGDDVIDGGDDTDTAVFDFATTAITSIQRDVDGVITLASATGTDTISNVESLQFTDQTLQVADLANTFANIDDETITGTSGDDVVDGGAGSDTFAFGYASTLVSAITNNGGVLTITGAAGTDTLSNIESLQFSDQTFAVSALTIGTANAETLNGTANADLIFAAGGADTIATAVGNDTILAIAAGSNVDGGAGTDTAAFTFASTDITSAVRQADQSVIITTAQGDTTLNNVEQLSFTDSSSAVTVDSILTGPKFTGIDGNGNPVQISPTPYTGAVDFLEYEHLGEATGDVVTGSEFNDFMNLLGGDDAANGGAGRDVLDGGTGSNFLTGGSGADTFFLDGRGGTTTWSTVTDFSGDNVNIWGWQEGVSQLIQSVENAGAEGFKGATFHYDLDRDGLIDTSITFSGLTTDQVPGSSAQEVAGNGYLLFA